MPTASEDPAVRAKRPWIVLGFAALTAGLIVARALGHEVDYELIILSGSIAGLDSVRSLVAQAGAAVVRKRSEPPAPVPPPAPATIPSPFRLDLARDLAALQPTQQGGRLVLAEPASDLLALLTVESLAPAVYGAFRGTATAWRSVPAFAELPRSTKVQWHAVAELALDLIHGDENAERAVVEHLADAAGGYADPDSDPPSPVGPEPDDDSEGDDGREAA